MMEIIEMGVGYLMVSDMTHPTYTTPNMLLYSSNWTHIALFSTATPVSLC